MDIRNFVIISHIDHGKSTLADRFLELTGTVEPRQMKPQYLDQLELERERGITIKMAPVRMIYHANRRITQNETQNNAEDFLYSDLAYKIRGAVFSVRKKLGLGHKEQVYHNALEIEFKNSGLGFESKKNISILYDGQKIGTYQPDFIIEDKVIVELKALPEIGRSQIEQLRSYLKGCDYKLALMVNFGGNDLKIKRVVYDKARCESAQVEDFILNLIDTPGHSDFSYEVSRALAAVEVAILLVDATKGIQAQTLANFENAKKAKLNIIGAVNKIDIASSEQIDNALNELANLLDVKVEEIFKISAKTGKGVEELLKAVTEKISLPINVNQRNNLHESAIAASPVTHPNGRYWARALIFDSFYNEHKGIIVAVRIVDGEIKSADEIYFIATDIRSKIKEIGYFSPQLKPAEKLINGEIGYIATGIKDPEKLKIGDTILAFGKNFQFSIFNFQFLALPGYQEPKPVVFVSFYPENNNQYEDLKKAFQKLRLNDSSLKIESDFNEALGRGFKVGFLGKLHFEITAERLEREFNIKIVNSFPSVSYKVKIKNQWLIIQNPKDLPDDFSEIWEPMINLAIITPVSYLGDILQFKDIYRWENIETENLGETGEKILITSSMPLAELISDFDDKLKSVSAGFASYSYKLTDFKKADLVKLEILVAGKAVAGLSRIIPKKRIMSEGRRMAERLKTLLPRQQFSQAIQALSEGRIIARETIPAARKDVTGYLYGGDRTRKMKLWQKQKKGKKKLLQIANEVKIPMRVFRDLLK